MKLLILTCSTGGGHTSAARAIAEAAGERGCECTIVDALDFLPGVDGKVISHGHTFVYRHLPSIFGVGYRFERRGGARAFRVECVRGAKNLALYLDGGGFDAVISVHIFASFMLAALCKRGRLELPTVNVATDYTCSPGFAECSLDLNCVPHGLKDEFVKCGLAPETVLETGIPVSREYGESEPRRSAREMLDLPLEGPLALLMCGSMGCGPMEWLAGELSRALPEGGTVAALCGTNDRLRKSLSRSGLDNVRAVGFTRQVSLWMDAADLIISKPGGLTSSEAMAKRLPMVVVDAVPGCETKNLEYLTSRGCAVTAPTEKIPALARGLLTEPERREEVRENIEKNFPQGAALRIRDAVLALIRG